MKNFFRTYEYTINARELRIYILFDTEFFYESIIFCLALLLQIFEVCTTIRYHLEKSTARMMIFLIILQVRCELVYFLAQNSNLYLRRTRVTIVALVLRDDYLLFLDC